MKLELIGHAEQLFVHLAIGRALNSISMPK